ncbi:M1 family metallopeptidase [Crocinitomicaceae bacterium]|nr:M1 family metallopeptidase [Crocinitomicaceae bacterium]
MRYFSFLLLIFVLFACNSEPIEADKKNTSSKTQDPHSYANVHEIRTEHLHLELDVNFDNQTIYGVARHTMSKHKTSEAIFDVKGLEIMKVTIGKEGKEKATEYSVGKNDELLGAPLKVKVGKNDRNINIYYKTTEATEALDWLPPSLTAGKEHPFLYTQGQAILTRSWIPLQDTPLSRITYSADITVPSDLMAVMSSKNPTERNDAGEYHFEMNQPIPAYLIAMAVGNLEYVSLGNKCGVYAEPQLTASAAYEFQDVPKMMQAAEELYGDYQWDQYDIVLLPYSFPFGGMENPRLTFANPTLLAGDQSLVSVVAHELAHSWSGNLVTNATWNDFWLNEGFTVYFENRIMEKLYGKETADILALIEFQDLTVALEDLAASEHPEDTHLKLELDHRSPDEGMTDIPYVKGAYFLRTLEQKVGRPKMDAFLERYFSEFAFKTITTADFETYLTENLLKPNKIQFNTKEWIYENGLPENCTEITSNRLDDMIETAQAFNAVPAQKQKISSFFVKKRSDFITQEWQTFIRNLDPNLDPALMGQLDKAFEFSTNANPAIKSDWFKLCVRTGYTAARPEMKAYLCKIGRRWFIESVYQCLVDSDTEGDYEFALEVFEAAKNNYHYVSRSTIEALLKKN